MARVKGGPKNKTHRKNILKQTKGYRFARSKKVRAAKEAIFHAGKYAFAHRRDKKNDFRKLWNVQLSAGLKSVDQKLSYSKFIGTLHKKNIAINRKMLAEMAQKSPDSFSRLVKQLA
ncbi:MAG TPA: 50S ribosomal protein L20 [Candidatus Paceibacterota bacterium]|nr:50S ribosomal protein L20 [Candidatus Paceibacterota bacterium]